MKGKVVNIKTTKLPYVRIDRKSIFGNPYWMVDDSDEERQRVIDLFRKYFFERLKKDPNFRVAVMGLQGKNLGCHCAPKKCHGDVILWYLSTQ